MSTADILKKIKKENIIVISEDKLKNLLSLAEIIEEKNTQISGMLRLLKLDGKLIMQEKSNKGEYLVRLMKTKKKPMNLSKRDWKFMTVCGMDVAARWIIITDNQDN